MLLLSHSPPLFSSLSIDSGVVSGSVSLPFEVQTFVGVGMYLEFDRKTGDVIVTGRDVEAKGDHQVRIFSVYSRNYALYF